MTPTDPRGESSAHQTRLTASRRRLLKGLGAAVALPAFDSLLPRGINAAVARAAAGLGTTATGAPMRMAFLYFPNGANQKLWWPEGQDRDFAFNKTMAPLESLKHQIQVLGGLEHMNATAGRDGGGGPCESQQHLPHRCSDQKRPPALISGLESRSINWSPRRSAISPASRRWS